MESQAPPPLLTLHFNKISQKDVFSYTQRSLRHLTVNTSVMSTKVSFPVLLIKNKTEFGGDGPGSSGEDLGSYPSMHGNVMCDNIHLSPQC